MYDFEIETKTQSGKYVFLTRANNGKDALNNLIEKSGDFRKDKCRGIFGLFAGSARMCRNR